MNKIKTHVQQWNRWRKINTNSTFHHVLVLIKLKSSPTFESFKRTEELYAGFLKGINSSLKDWPKEGFPIVTTEETENGVKFLVDISKKGVSMDLLGGVLKTGNEFLTKEETVIILGIAKRAGKDRDGDILRFFVEEDKEIVHLIQP